MAGLHVAEINRSSTFHELSYHTALSIHNGFPAAGRKTMFLAPPRLQCDNGELAQHEHKI